MKASEIKKVLESVKPGLSKKEVLEQASHILFKSGKVWTFNDEVSVRAPLNIGIEDFSVQADQLYEVVNRLSPESEVKATLANNELLIRAGKQRANLRTSETIKLPVEEEIQEPEDWKKIPESLFSSLRSVMFSASRSIPIFSCVHIKKDFLETCDDHRATRCSLNWEEEAEDWEINLIAKNAEKILSYNPTKYGIVGDWISFLEEGGLMLSIRIIPEAYPDISQIVNMEGKVDFELPSDLSDALDWASVPLDKPLTYDSQVKITIGKGRIVLYGKGESGWADHTINCTYKGNSETFEIHPGFFKDLIKLNPSVKLGENILRVDSKNLIHVTSLNANSEEG